MMPWPVGVHMPKSVESDAPMKFIGNKPQAYWDSRMAQFPVLSKLLLRVIVAVVWLWTKLMWRWETEDRQVLLDATQRRGCVIVMNHVSMLDPIVPYCELFYAGRNTRAIYKSEFNKVGIMRSILALIGGIPVERGTADVKALRRAQRSLQAGESLLVYPEGTRVKAGEPSVLHGGFALMAKMAHTKVIPMAIVGARDITPRGKHIPRPGKVYCKVGQPLDFDRFEGLGRKEQVVAMEQAAWDEVIRLRDELRDEHPGKM